MPLAGLAQEPEGSGGNSVIYIRLPAPNQEAYSGLHTKNQPKHPGRSLSAQGLNSFANKAGRYLSIYHVTEFALSLLNPQFLYKIEDK